jgi:hypothetical protein
MIKPSKAYYKFNGDSLKKISTGWHVKTIAVKPNHFWTNLIWRDGLTLLISEQVPGRKNN